MSTAQIELIKEEFFNPITKKNDCEERLYINDTPLHCGDVIQVLTPTGWKETRIEKSGIDNRWYLTSLPFKPVGLIAKIADDSFSEVEYL